MKPIDMILYCPNCGMQHIDAPESDEDYRGKHLAYGGFDNQWTNPPHKSHLCHGCRCVWRPADVATNGVAELKTSGKDDTWPAAHNAEVRAMPARGVRASDGGEAEYLSWFPITGAVIHGVLCRRAGGCIEPSFCPAFGCCRAPGVTVPPHQTFSQQTPTPLK